MLVTTIREDIKAAMLAGDSFRAETLKFALASLLLAEKNTGSAGLDRNEAVVILRKEIKKRYEAVEIYDKSGAPERAEKERAEALLLEAYVPPQLSGEDLRQAVERYMTNLSQKPTFSQAMKEFTEQYPDADKAACAAIIKSMVS